MCSLGTVKGWVLLALIVGVFACGCGDRDKDILPPPIKVENPSPADGDINVNAFATTDLSWDAGWGAYRYDVYLGLVESHVAEATPASTEFLGSTNTTSYDLSANLDHSTTYYWRVDSVNPSGVARGDVWCFTTQPPPPAAEFTAEPWRGDVPLDVNFTDTSAGIITSWEWDFDNDGTVDSTEQHASYQYTMPGWYTVKLTTDGPEGTYTCTKEMCILAANNIRYVDATVSSSGDGTTWPTAFKSIGEGLDAAVSGDVVLVADGTYTGTSNKEMNFEGEEIYLKAEDYHGTGTCIINCENDGRAFHLYYGEGLPQPCVIDGFRIEKGYVVEENGGGILCDNYSPIIKNCLITECKVIQESTGSGSRYGGGIACETSSNPLIVNCTISYNSAANGGGIYCFINSGAHIINCDITNNTSRYGGGIYCTADSSCTIADCRITGNSASSGGGGIYCTGNSDSTITNCTISKNFGGQGGGVSCNGSSITITNCVISDNSADILGGGVYCWSSGSATIINSTIVNNIARDGGGLCTRSDSSGATLYNTIIWGNSSEAEGNQIYVGANVTVEYCNYADYLLDPNNIVGWLTESNCINLDPLFVGSSVYDLQDTSPCIDAGANSFVPTGVTTDLGGTPRIVDGDDPPDGTATVDIGAYEKH